MPSSARDIRYGRRGGGWKDDPAPDRPDTTGNLTAVCPHCQRSYRYGDPEATNCGKTPCHELATWTPEAWEEKARLASVRDALGIPLSDLDRIALRYDRR